MTAQYTKKPLHGGDIITAAKRFDIDESDWLDLSTGINPEPYPLPAIPSQAFYQLPYLRDDFKRAVANYYGCQRFFPVAGSQMAIQALPAIIDSKAEHKILVPDIGYQEHATHWHEHGSEVKFYPALYADEMLDAIEVQLEDDNACHLLIINPNNPTAVVCDKKHLQTLADKLAEGFYVIIDEAFIDTTPENSLLSDGELAANIIVLRSFGKFFGLAGIRLGFVFAHTQLLAELENRLGLWQVNGPAQTVAMAALSDKSWHRQARHRIRDNATLTLQLLQPLLDKVTIEAVFSQGLFTAYMMTYVQAMALYEHLARRCVLTRVIELADGKALLRVGILSGRRVDETEKLSEAVISFNQNASKNNTGQCA